MTPEEILAECPELEIEKAFGVWFAYLPYAEEQPNGDVRQFIPWPVVETLAQSRKEARELREQLEKASECSCIYGCNHHEIKAFLESHRSTQHG